MLFLLSESPSFTPVLEESVCITASLSVLGFVCWPTRKEVGSKGRLGRLKGDMAVAGKGQYR